MKSYFIGTSILTLSTACIFGDSKSNGIWGADFVSNERTLPKAYPISAKRDNNTCDANLRPFIWKSLELLFVFVVGCERSSDEATKVSQRTHNGQFICHNNIFFCLCKAIWDLEAYYCTNGWCLHFCIYCHLNHSSTVPVESLSNPCSSTSGWYSI